MEVKGILDKIRKQEEEKKEVFFALQIDEGLVKSALWLVDNGQIKTVSLGKAVDWEKELALLEAVDASLSSTSENFSFGPETEEPSKIIFGLPMAWVKGEKISPEKLKILKKISERLELKPVGFVVTPEAIAYYLKTIEGVPPTAILVSLFSSQLNINLIRLGKLKEPQTVKRSGSLGEDVIEGLSRYSEKESFPARILLYGHQNYQEEAKQELMDYPWQEEQAKEKKVVFLHLPKVEVLPPDFDIKAVALAGGREVVKAAGGTAEIVVTPLRSKQAEGISRKKPQSESDLTDFLNASNFGFVEDKDVLKKEDSSGKPLEEKEAADENFSSPSLPETILTSGPFSEDEKKIIPSSLKPARFSFKPNLRFWKKIKRNRFFSSLTGPVAKVSISSRFSWRLGVVLFSLLLILGGLFFWYEQALKASIVLLVEPRPLEEEFEVVFDPSVETPDLASLTLPAEKVEVTIAGDLEAQTTGTKLTGEKAGGEVTIYNGTSLEKTFESGILLTSSGSLEFSLDETVTVASQSSAADPPGKVVAPVSAVNIGAEGNLASGTEFAVANYAKSDFVAKNESAFTGGTSREVQVVTQEDLDRLLADLTKSLKEQSEERLSEQILDGKVLLEESIESEISEQIFTHESEEESEIIGLNLSLNLSALAYNQSALTTLVEDLIKDEIPPGYEFLPHEAETRFVFQELTSEGRAIFKAVLKVNLLPKLELEEIKKNLKGKYPLFGKTYLERLPSVTATEIELRPTLPSKLMTFPRKVKNINIEIKVKQ